MNAKGIVKRILFGVVWVALCIGFLYASVHVVLVKTYFTFAGAVVVSAGITVGLSELIRWLVSADE